MEIEGTTPALRLRKTLQRSAMFDGLNADMDKDAGVISTEKPNPEFMASKSSSSSSSSSIICWLIVSISFNALFISALLIFSSTTTTFSFSTDSGDGIISSYGDGDEGEVPPTNGLIGPSTHANPNPNLNPNPNPNKIKIKNKNMINNEGGICDDTIALGSNTWPCSGHGTYEYSGDGDDDGDGDGDTALGARMCRCHPCFSGNDCSAIIPDCTINFDHGDPKMFELYWWNHRDLATTVLKGGDRMSYFSNTDGICWFLEPALAMEIKLMHQLVGNAVTDGREIIVGTGSSQIIHAAMYALSSSSSSSKPVDVVSMAPFYSSYPSMADYLRSGLHRWAGDARTYDLMAGSNTSYIEFVTSPGNPDGMAHEPVVDSLHGSRQGAVIYDLAYYWPQYMPISHAADHDIMLFTFSKSTGYAGTRIGWALVRDREIAKKMTKYIELNTIGVSKDSQIRASRVLRAVRRTYDGEHHHHQNHQQNHHQNHHHHHHSREEGAKNGHGLFDFGYREMESRWARLQAAISPSLCFNVSSPMSGHCSFFRRETSFNPAFAWLKCKKAADCHGVFKGNGILTRSGVHFGAGQEYVRISMVDHGEIFELFLTRLRKMSLSPSCGGGL